MPVDVNVPAGKSTMYNGKGSHILRVLSVSLYREMIHRGPQHTGVPRVAGWSVQTCLQLPPDLLCVIWRLLCSKTEVVERLGKEIL